MPPDTPLSQGLPPATPLSLVFLVGVVAMGSLCVWVAIAAGSRRGANLLQYEPRRQVPWAGFDLGVMMLLGFATFQVVHVAAGLEPGVKLEEMIPTAVARLILFDGASKLALVLVCTAVLAVRAGARSADLGLATSAGQLAADLRLGVLAFLAAVAPVYLIQLALYALQTSLGWTPTPHPLEKMLTDSPSFEMMAVALFTAVIVAPIFEEFVFRLVLQGWLEKVEAGLSKDDTVEPENDLEIDEQSDEAAAIGRKITENPADRPNGMFPILISSTLFALLHLGHGFDPVPLWVLAIGLGWIYHRTHRILPCIVLHMAFNAFGLTMLWLRP